MAELEILVRGDAGGKFAPERAIVGMQVEVSGPRRESVYSEAVDIHARLVAILADLLRRSTVSTWSSDSISVSSRRPYDAQGAPRDPVYFTDIGIEVEFVDVDELVGFVDTWAIEPGITIGGVRWDLTQETRRRHDSALRREAVADAVAKAQAYADAVGYGAVVPTRLADPQALGDQHPRARGAVFAAAFVDDGAPTLDLRSVDVELVVAVDARFVAEKSRSASAVGIRGD